MGGVGQGAYGRHTAAEEGQEEMTSEPPDNGLDLAMQLIGLAMAIGLGAWAACGLIWGCG